MIFFYQRFINLNYRVENSHSDIESDVLSDILKMRKDRVSVFLRNALRL